MSNERKLSARFSRVFKHVRLAFSIGASEEAEAKTTTVQDLINEGLRQRQANGVVSARPFFESAAALAPDSPVPFFMLGNVASEVGDLDTAVRHYERARDLNPTDCVIRYNLGLNQLWRGYVDIAIRELRYACELDRSYLKAQSTLMMALHHSDVVSPEHIAAVTRDWGAWFEAQQPREKTRSWESSENEKEVLRIGFISGDLRTHSVAHFFEPIASARNPRLFRYVFYSTAQTTDAVTERFMRYADRWRDVSQFTDDALIEAIRGDQIDVLVDLSGHTDFNRLAVFARRAARVQIAYLGYPDSTGLPTMDFRITDASTDPQQTADEWHAERLLRLPVSQWCFRPYGSLLNPGPLPAVRAGFITFGSFNNLSKVSNTIVHCWISILLNVPHSRLRLTRVRSPQRAADIIAQFVQAGVSAQRIECVPYRSNVPYGVQFEGCDIALDPYPYTGVTTTCESLYFGLPVVTLYGRNGVSRSGLSILECVGLRELAAASPDEYVNIATELARSYARIASMRESLRLRFELSSLRDEPRCAENFERLLLLAWSSRVA